MLNKWNEAKIIKSVKGYKTYAEWFKGNQQAYQAAYRRKLINKICVLMGWGRLTKWTYKGLIKSTEGYSTYVEWYQNESGAYQAACNMGHLNKICKFKGWVRRPRIIWTEEKLIQSSKGYKSFREWFKNNRSAYKTAFTKDLIDKICHLRGWKRRVEWTEATLIKSTKMCKSFNEWFYKQNAAYHAARRRNMVDKLIKLNGWTRNKL